MLALPSPEELIERLNSSGIALPEGEGDGALDFWR
jgi:hypothetical protein